MENKLPLLWNARMRETRLRVYKMHSVEQGRLFSAIALAVGQNIFYSHCGW